MKAKHKGQNGFGVTTGLDVYEIRPRKGSDGIDLISDRFRYGPIWYAGPDAIRNAVAYAKYRSLSRSQRAIIRVLNDSGAVIQTDWLGSLGPFVSPVAIC
jgi:hypothetical protein